MFPANAVEPVTEADELAALLVGRDEHRRGTRDVGGRGVGVRRARSLESGGQLQDLTRRPDVVIPEQRHPRRRRRRERARRSGPGSTSPSNASITRPRIDDSHPFTAPARPRTK